MTEEEVTILVNDILCKRGFHTWSEWEQDGERTTIPLNKWGFSSVGRETRYCIHCQLSEVEHRVT